MESKHKQRLRAEFPEAMQYKEVYVLEIEDNYSFMDTELIEELQNVIDPIIEEWRSDSWGPYILSSSNQRKFTRFYSSLHAFALPTRSKRRQIVYH